MSIDAMKQALEALEECALALDWVGFGDCRYLEVMRETGEYTRETTPAITALRQAIEQAEQAQPVAWYVERQHVGFRDHGLKAGPFWKLSEAEEWTDSCHVLKELYTAPPRKPWVGLTGDEVNEFAAGCHLGNSVQGAIRKAEAKIKEKTHDRQKTNAAGAGGADCV